LTPIIRLYRNNERNFCGGAVEGFVGGSAFCRFLTSMGPSLASIKILRAAWLTDMVENQTELEMENT